MPSLSSTLSNCSLYSQHVGVLDDNDISSSQSSATHHSRSSQLSQSQRLMSSQMDLKDLGWTEDPVEEPSPEDESMDIVDETSSGVRGFDDRAIQLEMNDLNQQPCMVAMVRTIQRMSALFDEEYTASEDTPSATTTASQGNKWQVEKIPIWLEQIIKHLGDFDGSSKNVRLFMLRLLMNQPVAQIVRRWARSLLPVVLACTARDLLDESIGEGIHYVLKGVVLTLCDVWDVSVLTDRCAADATTLISYLLRFAYETGSVSGGDDEEVSSAVGETEIGAKEKDTRMEQLYKENARIIGRLLLLWVPTGVLGQLDLTPIKELLSSEAGMVGGAHGSAFSKGMVGDRKRKSGLLLLQILLECNYPVLSDEFNVVPGVQPLLLELLENIKSRHKPVFQSACRVAGLVISTIRNPSYSLAECIASDENFEEKVNEIVASKAYMEKSGPDLVAAGGSSNTLRHIRSHLQLYIPFHILSHPLDTLHHTLSHTRFLANQKYLLISNQPTSIILLSYITSLFCNTSV